MDIILQSIPETIEQRSWVAIPVSQPNSIGVLTVDQRQFYAQIIDGVLYSYVALAFGKSAQGTYTEVKDAKPDPFVWSEWIVDDPLGLVPQFRAVIRDTNSITELTKKPDTISDNPNKASLFQEVDNNVRKVFRYNTYIKELGMNIVGTIEIFSGQDIVNFTVQLSCTEDIGKITISRLYMTLREESISANAKARNLESRYLGEGVWANDLLGPTVLYQGFTTNISGAILCRNGKPPTLSDEIRLNNLTSRKEARIVGKVN